MSVDAFFQLSIHLMLLVLLISQQSIFGVAPPHSSNTERIYFLKKCAGAGCPYTASWLIHVNLYRKLTWWLDVTKMEAASFNV